MNMRGKSEYLNLLKDRINLRQIPFSERAEAMARHLVEQAWDPERLVAHLTDERQFWTRYSVPTVAMDDPKYHPGKMWRGPTWVNVNYLLIEGLQRSGYADLAIQAAQEKLQ